MEGWVKIHREIVDWEWYKDANTKSLFLHLLITANSSDTEYKGQVIKRGELIVTLAQLSEQLGMSVKAVRVALEHLIKTEEVGKRNGKPIGINGMILSVCKYDYYNTDGIGQSKSKGKPKGKRGANERAHDSQSESSIFDTVGANQRANPKEKEETPSYNLPKEEERSEQEDILNPTPLKKGEGLSSRSVFEKFYNDTFSEAYYWTAKDAGQMAQLMKKIKFSRESKGMPTDDVSLNESLGKLLCSIKDKWLLENLSVSNVNSKYNEIVASARSERAKKTTGMNVGVVLTERPKYTKGW